MADTEKPPAMEPEQAADLAALTAGAAGAAPAPEAPGQNNGGGEVAEIQPPSAAAMQMAMMAVGMLRPLICYAVPALKDSPDELWAPVPEGVAAVMDHYGASADWMQSPWARLGLSLTPLMAFAAMEAMKAPPKPVPVPPPGTVEKAADGGSKTVSFGDPLPA